MSANQIDSEQGFSGVAQTGNIGNATSVSSGAAKIFREFKWGLLTLFILMTVVVCLVYDGGRAKKKPDVAQNKPATGLDTSTIGATAPTVGTDTTPAPIGTVPTLPGQDRLNARADEHDVWRSDSNTGLGAGNATGNQTRRNSSSDSSSHLYDPVNDEAALPTTPPPNRLTLGEGARRNARTTPKPPVAVEREQHREHEEAPRSREVSTPAPASGFKWYVVKSGDNLTRIANANLPGKGGNKAITEANKDTLPDPNKLREGMKIRIPNSISSVLVSDGKTRTNDKVADENRSEILRQKSPKTTERHGDSNLITQDDYVVQPGDTMERIARKVLNDFRRWKDLVEWNKDRVTDASKLKVGTVLRTHPMGQAPMMQPLVPEAFHRRQHTVRADAEPEAAIIKDSKSDRIADDVQLPIHPIAAQVTAPADGTKSKKNTNPGNEDDAIIRAQILP